MNHFKGRHFQKDIILVAVGYCFRFSLSYREIEVSPFITPQSCVGFIIMALSLSLYVIDIKLLTLKIGESMNLYSSERPLGLFVSCY